MDAATTVAATAAIIAVGEWSKPVRKLGIKNVVGFMVLAVGLSVMENANAEFASKMGALVLVSALFIYAVPITKKLGFAK